MDMYHNFFIQSSVLGLLDCFHILATVENSVMNIGVQISFLDFVFGPLGYIPRNERAGMGYMEAQF